MSSRGGALRGPMNRIILLLTTTACLTVTIAGTGEAERDAIRTYVLGPGAAVSANLPPPAPRVCLTQWAASEVCFLLAPGETAVTFVVEDDLDLAPVAASVYFEDAAGLPMAGAQAFCGASPLYPVPAGAKAARVVLGPLANGTLMPGCATGLGTTGIVKARIF